ncbi:MAG: hypothetical protein GY874_05435 [Desulfobacteraceae bacterium]|nr:hypothetical protein [Desulfobacteraceae bacterium]
MRKKSFGVAVLSFLFSLVFILSAIADGKVVNIPITANQAFDAVVNQVDPNTGENARAALIDVRTSAEYYWAGACGKVESILTASGNKFYPYNGKVIMKPDSNINFKINSAGGFEDITLCMNDIEKIVTTDISIHIPTHIWNEEISSIFANPDFSVKIESLSDDYDVLILMCRSGFRSDARGFNTSLFDAIYEIDDPGGKNGYGGFQGSSYTDAYNGYRGYPGRITSMQVTESVSWTDAGLPIHIGWSPSK